MKVLCRVLGFQWEKAALGVTLVVYLAVVRVAELQRQVHFFGVGRKKCKAGWGEAAPCASHLAVCPRLKGDCVETPQRRGNYCTGDYSFPYHVCRSAAAGLGTMFCAGFLNSIFLPAPLSFWIHALG